jgi:hypothetical protein
LVPIAFSDLAPGGKRKTMDRVIVRSWPATLTARRDNAIDFDEFPLVFAICRINLKQTIDRLRPEGRLHRRPQRMESIND